MKKAKSVGRRKTARMSVNANHLRLEMDDVATVSELQDAEKQKFYALSGSIRQLMSVHNALYETTSDLTQANAAAVGRACRVLEAEIDQKIDAMNDFLSHELDSVRKTESKRAKKPKRKVTPKQSKIEKLSKSAKGEKPRKTSAKARPKSRRGA